MNTARQTGEILLRPLTLHPWRASMVDVVTRTGVSPGFPGGRMRRMVGCAVVTCVALLAVPGMAGASTPIATTGAVTILGSPPASVQLHALVSTTAIQGFSEAETVLSSGQPVDTDTPGLVNNVTQLAPATVPSGTCVDSYLLEWDPGGLPQPQTAQADGSVTFDQQILGVEALDASLDASDPLGSPSTSYPTGIPSDERGMELTGAAHTNRSGNPDTFTLSGSLRKLTVHMDTGAYFDQIRVLVGCGPGTGTPEVPAVLALPVTAALVLGGALAWHRRRRILMAR
jgi:hypothetical protein